MRLRLAGFFIAGGENMKTYEYLQHMKNFAEELGARTTDTNLRVFYANVARGFEIRQHKLTLAEAAK